MNYNENKRRKLWQTHIVQRLTSGKGFFTHQDRNDFYLSGHPGDVWVVGNNAAGVSWINRVSGTAKVKADAQAIVDGKMEEYQAEWDAFTRSGQSTYYRVRKPNKTRKIYITVGTNYGDLQRN